MASKKEFEMAIKIAGEIEKSFYESSKLTQKELKNIARKAVLASEAMPKSSDLNFTESLRKGLKDAEPAFSSLEKRQKAHSRQSALLRLRRGRRLRQRWGQLWQKDRSLKVHSRE